PGTRTGQSFVVPPRVFTGVARPGGEQPGALFARSHEYGTGTGESIADGDRRQDDPFVCLSQRQPGFGRRGLDETVAATPGMGPHTAGGLGGSVGNRFRGDAAELPVSG